ncbi:nucleotide sugar dehydrogenase [Pseudoxanthomonas mexicana]|uniref:nucleotide sugar dehydrogenase n=1 Tax=Pseudoxanthomonas mexicana TaxID=128785 RepID=UPI000AF416A1|nr:nucleotide sugar dehydrogenase [Pseudoxanthomonas mexicana]
MERIETTSCHAKPDRAAAARYDMAFYSDRQDAGEDVDHAVDVAPDAVFPPACHAAHPHVSDLLADVSVAVVGLGHVGLRVAVAMAGKFPTVGFDVDETRVSTLRKGIDCIGDVAQADLATCRLALHSDPAALADSNFFIVAVPTLLTPGGKPDICLLESACATIGKVMPPGATVVFESTVYPGATEEVCGPALECASGMRCGIDFQLGYSPERLNPGDAQRGFASIVKLVSAQDARTLDRIAAVYETVVTAGVYRASSIKVAEAAKALENTQRDVNIALVNEMAKICGLLGIRTHDVLHAAGSKWNFLPFTPGLAGGHCVGVDPCYLADKAQHLGYHPDLILAARRINDSMPAYIASQIVLKMAAQEKRIRGARVGIMGITFKEGVPDLRDSRAVELAQALAIYGIQAHVADPRADVYESRSEYGIELEDETDWGNLDVLVLAVPHPEFLGRLHEQIDQSLRREGMLVDLKAVVDPATLREDLFYMSL